MDEYFSIDDRELDPGFPLKDGLCRKRIITVDAFDPKPIFFMTKNPLTINEMDKIRAA